MPTQEGQRHTYLLNLIQRLERGENVPTKEILRILTTDERAAFDLEVSSVSDSKMHGKTPLGLKSYVDCLQRADLLFANAQRSKPRPLYGPKALGMQSPVRAAESAYEHALEVLEELLSRSPGFRSWLDRPVFFNDYDHPTADPESVPRLVTSRSQYARNPIRPSRRMKKLKTLQNIVAKIGKENFCASEPSNGSVELD